MDIVSVLHLQEKRLQIAYNHVYKVRMEIESCRRAGYSGMNTLDQEQIDALIRVRYCLENESTADIDSLLEIYDKENE